jgi:amino acid adenylation domain-containing protein
MTFQNISNESQKANISTAHGHSNNDAGTATKYWEELFQHSGPQSRLHCFPLEYNWPRSESTITAADGLLEGAISFCKRHNFLIHDLFYAIWAIVSSRHTIEGQKRTAFTVAGKDRSLYGQNGGIQLPDHDFPLILTVPGDINILSWIRHVANVSVEASSYAHIGYKKILRTTSAYDPQVKITLNWRPNGDDVSTADADFPLVINMLISTRLKLSVRHNSSIPKMDVRVLLNHFTATLHRAIEKPQICISDMQIMPPMEAQLLQQYGEAAVLPSSGLIHHLIERQAKLTPNADAVQFELDKPLTYSTLNVLANQLARKIRSYGASVVPVHMRTSIHFIVALLAVLKAGAAYVILDPDSGSQRRSHIIQDIQAGFVLVDENTAGEFERELKVEDLLTQSMGYDESDIIIDQLANDVAYIIYTSGSSGTPKAVLLEHHAAFNGLQAFPKITGLRQLLFSNPVFSAAQRSIWATLSVGGCLCLASKDNITVNLAKMIETMRINSIDMTSTTASLISPDQVPSLRRLVLGGEPVNSSVVQKWAHRVELFSSYGLSECTQLNWRCRLLTDTNARNIGQPSDTTTSYILIPGTTSLSPLLIPGELCLGGFQLARGYLNHPEETEKRFIRNPFGPGRLYRTGDMAVRHADGSVELIGRIDFQVKINGQRVDPGEPNSVIQAHEDVKYSAVVPALINKKMLLVAAIVSRPGTHWDSLVDDLRSSLRSRTPVYMMPSFWVPLSALPLNANGKTDMAAIRKIVEGLADSGQLLPARSGNEVNGIRFTHNESVLRNLWAEVLSLPDSHISLQDSFTSLGGTSLEAIQVVSRLRSEHALTLQVKDIILGDSLSGIAELAQQQTQDGTNKDDRVIPFSLLREPLSLENANIGYSEIEDAFPVTPFQEATIADTIMGGKSFIYSRSYNFTGHDTATIKAALVSLAKYNPLLRTTFLPKGATFVQVVKKSVEIPWENLDMDVKEYMRNRASELMYAGDLWWRAAVLPGNVLVITTHHALFDYWSNEFVPQDLTSILLGKVRIPRPEFRTYVEHLQQYDDQTMKDFWRDYLEGAKAINLVSTGPEISVTARLRFDLKGTAAKLSVTPSVLLYAAWSIVLANIGSSDDVVFGVTLSGRDAQVPGILEMNGPTLMIVPLRVKLNNSTSFKDHLRSIQNGLWDLARNAPYGLRRILKASGQTPSLVDSMVNFLIKLSLPMPAGGLVKMPEELLGSAGNVKIELNNDNLDLISVVSGFDRAFAQSLADTIAFILESSSSAPLTEIGNYKLIQPVAPSSGNLKRKDSGLQLTERVHSPYEALGAVNNSHPGDLAHSAFLRAAASYPGRTAVQDASGTRITYAGLAIKANQLAGLLRAKGLVLEQVIPIMLEKSINTVVAIYGILIAGGAFLPLGPDAPQERNLGILEDIDGKIVIADRSNADFFVNTGYEVIILDDLKWDTMPVRKQVVPELTPKNLAYVIYTSGSSGKPKGTLLTHEGVPSVTDGIIEATKTDVSHRFLWALNYTFDGSLDTFFTALSSGCTLCVASQSAITTNLAGLINTMGVNRVNITPSMTKLMSPAEVPTLKVLITGGEPITAEMVATWAPHVTLYNAYGPTEATICITTRPVELGMNVRNIGRPFKNVTALILDPETTKAVPDGSVGELCLSGPQLARGYLNRPESTKQAFMEGPNGKIYRTGDLAKLLPNGEIELFGRKDDQVKINGYRIELGEIENVVMKAGLFEECVVIAATVFKRKQLVGFYTRSAEITEGQEQSAGLLLSPGDIPDNDRIKDRLTTIPDYMIPTIWLPLSKLPFSAAGKIDRKRLQVLVESMTDGQLKEYLPQELASEITSGAEFTLQSLWSALFDTPINEIHASSSFHALGGDSISALNLVSMLRRHGYDIKVKDILSRKTLRQQAELMENSIKSIATQTAQEMQYQPPNVVYEKLSDLGVAQSDIEDIYPCSPGQIEFLTQGNKKEQFWQLMSVRELPDDFDFDRWIQLTTRLTQNNQILRALYLYIDVCNPQTAVQVVLKHPPLNLRYQTFDSEEEKQHILNNEWEMRFEQDKPFVRYTCLTDNKQGKRYLVVKLDHASYDGTLLHIFDDQFKALHNGQPIPKHTPFRDFISHIISTPKAPQLDYWVRLLENKSFNFPPNKTNPMISRTETAKISIDVGVDTIASFNGVTAPTVFQTAYSLLLAHLSGTHDVIYDNLITGRNVALDNPQLIDGNCANFLPFHSHVSGDTSIEALLKDTQVAFWTATENGFVSLGEIYEALGSDHSRSAAKCLFCFQPFEPEVEQDPMRWVVMKLSKNTMFFNYAIQLEVVKAASKGEYVVRFGYDGDVFTREDARTALDWYVGCLVGMTKTTSVEGLGI